MMHTIWGAISILCTLAISSKLSIPLGLLSISIFGLYLSSHYQVRGFIYSLILLAISGVVQHGLIVTDHLFYLGLEASLALAFFITALNFEEDNALMGIFDEQIKTQQATIANLEDEILKNHENSLLYKSAMQDKVSMAQKELEDLQSEHSSILILNDVLRKTSARLKQENGSLQTISLDQKRRFDILKDELCETTKDFERLSKSDALSVENKNLFSELNTARYDREQTLLMNETLTRLYARESLKVQEIEVEASAFAEQLGFARREVLRQQKALEEVAKQPIQDPQIADQIAYLQQKMVKLYQTEPLLKQLKKQFEEKNQTLHQTRSELFKVDTELQKVKMEKSALEISPIPKEIEEELQSLGSQVCSLEEENQHLQELVGTLLESSQDGESRKKKVKMKPLINIEQSLLF